MLSFSAVQRTINHETIAVAAGPYSVNGVPMRRVNQAYVIATSMSIDVSKVTIPATDDSYFTREETAKKTDEDQFFEQAAKVRHYRCRRYPKLPRCDGSAVAAG